MAGIGWYNGWGGEERMAALPLLKAALAEGRIAYPTQCSVCLAQGIYDWRSSDAIVFHDEDYRRPLEAYPVCKPCHSLIHLRFWRHREWDEHIARYARGGSWFELLSRDPDIRRRPFSETYPKGLPGPFAP